MHVFGWEWWYVFIYVVMTNCKLRCLIQHSLLDPVITMYFAPNGEDGYVRSPSKSIFLWGQSVFIIAQLLTAGLLHINELDTIRRYLPSYNRPRKGGRYSAFQVSVAFHNFFFYFIGVGFNFSKILAH